jgi:hypothetical protein
MLAARSGRDQEAQLYERSRELSVVEENRLRATSMILSCRHIGISLTAEAAASNLDGTGEGTHGGRQPA